MSTPCPVVVGQAGHELVGVTRPGESWAAAARRTAATWHGVVEPLDLSGEEKRFVIDPDHTVTVRPMTRGDLPCLARWRAAEHVRRWWQDDAEPTLEQVTERYGPRIDGLSATRMWVGEINGRSVGFVQDYRLADYPDYPCPAPGPDTVGLDYAIGDPAWTGRGFGPRLLWAWLLRARHRFPDVRHYVAAPDHRNEASLRMLDKTGFTRGLWFDEPTRAGGTVTGVACTLDVLTVLG